MSCYNHDIEQTAIALMEGEVDGNSKSLHPRLRALDKSLPARKKGMKESYNFGGSGDHNDGHQSMDQDDEEARKIQKEQIKEVVKAQEEEA